MKDFNVTEIFAAVKCQFVRRCTHSEAILTRLADDFVARYSAKHRPHPEFFKEDVYLTQNQLIMYADECVQVMRKFQFLNVGAEIISGLTNATFRIVDFLSKQLYHHMKDTPSTVTNRQNEDALCSACCRLRENQRVRSLREELSMQHQGWDDEKALREMVVRTGEKYDEQELIYQSLESLQVLNEQEIRKKLGKMQSDHDKRKKEILVAVEELTRANERVTSYSRALERSGKQFSGKFNVKDYVFQLGRHFYHNISSLDIKIKQLKQSISPVEHQEIQTQEPVIIQSTHNQVVANLMTEMDRLKNTLSQANSGWAVEQRKGMELQQMNLLLQQKLQDSDVKRQHEKIEEKVASTQIKNTLTASENRIKVLEALLRKIKTSKGKDQDILDQISVKQDENASEVKSGQENIVERNLRGNGKTITHIRESFLITPKDLMRISGIKSVSQEFTQRFLQMIPSAREMLTRICEQTQQRLVIAKVYDERYIPPPKMQHKMCHAERKASKEREIHKDKEFSNELIDQEEIGCEQTLGEKLNEMETIHRRERKKLSKIDVGKLDFIRSSNHRESIYVQHSEIPHENQKKKPTQRNLAFQDLKNSDERLKLTSKKIFGSVKTSIGLPTFKSMHDKETLKRQFAERLQLEKRKKHKKARNLSQENSYELSEEYQQIRQSIDQMQRKDRSLLGEKERQILVNSLDGELKMSLKGSIHRNECARIVLSLEQINYSTYFYSLLASLHLKSQGLYQSVRRFMVSLVPGLYDDQNSIKDSLNCLILAHRRCNPGSICSHLELFLDKVRRI